MCQLNHTNREAPSQQYFENHILEMSESIEDVGLPKADLVLYLAITYLILFICLAKGFRFPLCPFLTVFFRNSVDWKSRLYHLNLPVRRPHNTINCWAHKRRLIERHQVLFDTRVGAIEGHVGLERRGDSDFLLALGQLGRVDHARELQRIRQQHYPVINCSDKSTLTLR
jgi:hypothetical protein